ncbi:unnamed protein product [Schistosoma curassoni]|uniref:Uncharacterized protein n=1 Tax=Schistosoma curassoni TaxID=6186 RepID=A0A183K547_9TREM|nr:unnamed protein product [Schistosoma curassoni]
MNRLMSDWGLDGISVQFYPIKNYECIGIAAEQNPTFYSNMGKRFWPALGYGYNAGILLIHLTKLRARGWDEIWMKTAFNLMREKRILPTGEQDVINAVLNRNKHWLYEIPCKWNIQLSAFSMRERCPVVWEFLLNRDDDNNNNNYRRKKKHYVTILYYNIQMLN